MSVRSGQKESQAKQNHEQARVFSKSLLFQLITSDIQCAFKSKTISNKRYEHRKYLKTKKGEQMLAFFLI